MWLWRWWGENRHTTHVCPAMNMVTFPVAVCGVWPNSVPGMAPALVETFLGISVRRSPDKNWGKHKCHFCVGSSISAQMWAPIETFSKVRCLSCPAPPLSLISQLPSQSWQQYARLPSLECAKHSWKWQKKDPKVTGWGEGRGNSTLKERQNMTL